MFLAFITISYSIAFGNFTELWKITIETMDKSMVNPLITNILTCSIAILHWKLHHHVLSTPSQMFVAVSVQCRVTFSCGLQAVHAHAGTHRAAGGLQEFLTRG